MTERTLSIVKPDAVKKNVIGEILRRFEAAGLKNCHHQNGFSEQSRSRRLLCSP